MTEEQIRALEAYCMEPVGPYKDWWDISVDKYSVCGFTCMNNNLGESGGLEDWFAERGITKIKWDNS